MSIQVEHQQQIPTPKKPSIFQKLWHENINLAPPTVANIEVAYVPLQRLDKDNKKHDIGVFVPELYYIAKAQMLPEHFKAQECIDKPLADYTEADKQKLQKEKSNVYSKLFGENGRLRTPFELAMIPSYEPAMIFVVVKRAYTKLLEKGKPLPPTISKIRAPDDYMAHISKAGLIIKEDGDLLFDKSYKPTSGHYCYGAQAVHVSVDNHPSKTPLREKLYHFVGNNLAFLVTMSAAVSVTGISTPLSLLLYFVGTYIYMRNGSDFDFYEKAKNLSRDQGSFLSKAYWKDAKFSVKNALITLVQLTALGLGAYLAATAAWSGIMALPFLQWAPAVEMAIAGFFSAVAGIGSFVAFSGAMRYLQGLSPFDNQISPPQAEIIQTLPIVTEQMEKAIRRGFKKARVVKSQGTLSDLQQQLEREAALRGTTFDNLLSPEGKRIFYSHAFAKEVGTQQTVGTSPSPSAVNDKTHDDNRVKNKI